MHFLLKNRRENPHYSLCQSPAPLCAQLHFQFSGAISFVVNCETQEEIDYFWEALSAGGEKGQCGWVNRDKFGVTWQIVPTALGEMLSDKDPEKSQRVMKAMLKMNKMDIKTLKEAYERG